MRVCVNKTTQTLRPRTAGEELGVKELYKKIGLHLLHPHFSSFQREFQWKSFIEYIFHSVLDSHGIVFPNLNGTVPPADGARASTRFLSLFLLRLVFPTWEKSCEGCFLTPRKTRESRYLWHRVRRNGEQQDRRNVNEPAAVTFLLLLFTPPRGRETSWTPSTRWWATVSRGLVRSIHLGGKKSASSRYQEPTTSPPMENCCWLLPPLT